MARIATVAVMLVASAIATAAQAQPCPPPPGFAGWDRPIPLSAATSLDEKPVATLVPGRAAAVTLAATERLRFRGPAPHLGGPIRYGGLAMLEVRLAGTYRLALGGPAWIDVVSNGRAIESIAHGHAPECSNLRKMVDFRLMPGRYVVQLSDAVSPSLEAMVVRVGA